MRGTAVVVAATLASATTGARADTRADALFAQGRDLEQAGNYAKACAKFAQVVALDPAAVGALINLGECHEKQHQLVAALAAYREADLRAEHYSQREYEDAAGEGIRAIEGRIPVIHIELAAPLPAGSVILVDGQPIDGADLATHVVDPGDHTVEIRAPHKRSLTDAFTLAEKGQHTVHVALADGDGPGLDPGHARRRLAYELAGGALLVYAGEITAGLVYASQYKALCPTEDTCGAPANRTQANTIDSTSKIVITGLFGVGTAVAGAAVYVYLTAPKRERVTAVTPIVGADRVGVAYTTRF